VTKKRRGKYRLEEKRKAVERIAQCESIRTLARELGVGKSSLYRWQSEINPEYAAAMAEHGEEALRQEVKNLKRVLAEKTLEIDFFRGALQKVEARRQGSGRTGGRASTTRSGK
jgi:transposase-like protein